MLHLPNEIILNILLSGPPANIRVIALVCVELACIIKNMRDILLRYFARPISPTCQQLPNGGLHGRISNDNCYAEYYYGQLHGECGIVGSGNTKFYMGRPLWYSACKDNLSISGLIKQGRHKYEIRDGTDIIGTIDAYRGTYHGVEIHYYNNMITYYGRWNRGRRVGKHRCWYTSGQLKDVITYPGGAGANGGYGAHMSFHPNGQLNYNIKTYYDRPHGYKLTKYGADGEMLSQSDWKRGRLISLWMYSDGGVQYFNLNMNLDHRLIFY